MRMRSLVLAVVALVAVSPADAQQRASTWVTLGTMGGPIASPDRSQPANVLLVQSGAILVDAGDGTAEQLAKAGVPLPRVRAVLLSHLHFDHTGGLAAILGLRYQTNVPGKLAIYGPPGTRALVDGLVASMRPAAEAGYGLPGEPMVRPEDTVTVTELTDGSRTDVAGVPVTAAQNSHYSFAPGSEPDRRFKSLSFRFALPDRVIAYTGDTGPSGAVERLARGADLLVSEMIDVAATVANVRRNTPDMSAGALAGLTRHLSEHHLTAHQVGEMAARAGVKQVVVTHLVATGATPQQMEALQADVEEAFKGKVTLAHDLDRF